MECWRKRIWSRELPYTAEALRELKIDAPNEEIRKKVLKNWDNVAKPIDGMGRFEALTAQIGAICGSEEIDISKKAVVIMCADNGIVEEKVSQSGQEVTLAVAKNMARKRSSVGRMAETIGADTIPVDIGINCREKIPGVLDRKIRCGTRNFRREPAMTQEEALRAVFTGIEIAAECREKGYKIIATGEMGIGNTTASSAVAAALLGCEAAEVTGRGAGLSDEGLLRKQRIIAEAIEKYELRDADALRVLAAVGGLDMGGLAGICIGGAIFHMPVVLDGVISMAAALAAERLAPGTRAYLLPSHKGKEPVAERLSRELGISPVIDGGMALGEGTGAVMMLALLDMALAVYWEGAAFSDICVEKYERF
ncbi:MAG: nicotinate-nucleotide--dimethylbenzimidazole phosphoribosyltransferase [Clostridium sp.]|nr:nicotinate-nucleotide--dimethylbenzimidazole phosphoribosyltransferase [Clostridium sp.]